MRDIVATIAAEQDVVIRAPLGTCLVVQGGPGTGKTAVGLHRAAFLLYEHRRTLDAGGVLVIGPNPIFLRYIAQVLPSLGETAARQTTLDRLLAGTTYRVTGTDGDAAAVVKGDARMATVIARAVAGAVHPPADELAVTTAWGTARVTREALAELVAAVQAREVPHNVGRAAFRTQAARLVRADLLRRRSDEEVTSESVDADLRSRRDWGRALDRIWPSLRAPALVRNLLTSRTALAAAADGTLSAPEQATVRRPPGRRAADEPWTVADLGLLDEAEAAITGPPRRYGHIVVDEAQDLSAMGLRALARRSRDASMTVLGDLAQATAPAAQESWEAAIAHLGGPPTAQRADLDIGYRVPASIMDMANGLLAEAAPGVTPCRSVRPGGRPPALVRVDEPGDGAALAAAVADAVAGLTAAHASVAVIAPGPLRPAVDDALHRGAGGVTVLDPPEAKGLEFDAVVVAEPALIATGTSRGLRLLYVALTRAVQELVVVHARPLPGGLDLRAAA
jgi:DNA helicase IV